MKNHIFLSVMVLLAYTTSYAMQEDVLEFNSGAAKMEQIRISSGYRKITGISQEIEDHFCKAIEAIESFWNDQESCNKVVNELRPLVEPLPQNDVQYELRQDFNLKNFHIIIGTAYANRDLARILAQENETNLDRMNALPRTLLLQQANINLAFVKKYLSILEKNNYYDACWKQTESQKVKVRSHKFQRSV